MYAWGRLRGNAPIGRREWLYSFWVGALLFTIGSGILTAVQLEMPSGLAALVVATVPLWMVAIEAFRMRYVPGWRTWTGLSLGAAGVAVVFTTEAAWPEGSASPWLIVAALAGSLAWAAGSLATRRSPVASLRLRAGSQLLAGGLVLSALSLARGEWAAIDASAVAVSALVYLSAAGSIAAFLAYSWLLRVTDAAKVATYAFVNPVVAIAAGALLLSEAVTVRTATATALIVASVMVINGARLRRFTWRRVHPV